MASNTTDIYTIDKDGWYLITLIGGSGSDANATYKGGNGGLIKAMVLFTAGDILTLISYKGGINSGDAVLLLVNDIAIFGAGGASSGVHTGNKSTDIQSSGKSVTGKETVLLYFSGAGTSYYSSTNGSCPIGCIPAAANGAGSGAAGYNFYTVSENIIPITVNNIKTTSLRSSYTIEGFDINNIPKEIGKSISKSTLTVFQSEKSQYYEIKLQSQGGDIITGEIFLTTGDLILYSRSLNNTIGCASLILNGDPAKIIIQTGSAGGTLLTTPTPWDTWINLANSPNSYYNGDYISSPVYTKGTNPTSNLCYITPKTQTEQDSYESAKLQADALNRIADATEQMIGGIGGIPIITVVAGKPFEVAVNKYDDMATAVENGVTVTNSVVGDGCVVVSGTLNTPGIHTYKIAGKQFIITVVTEPNSSNVLVTFN